MDKLIIVESPSKATTIKKFLGGSTKVVATKGHLRDLPKSRLAVDIKAGFVPEYIKIRGRGDDIKKLIEEAKKAKKIFIATDPDREGEAIAWHTAFLLGIDEKDVNRVAFNEITESAVKEAIKKPRLIDINVVNAQQARRILDRIVGYGLSPVLWKKVKSGLSAGRVQSATLKLIIDREKEINDFVPEEYWNIEVVLNDGKKDFKSKYFSQKGMSKKETINDGEIAKEILDDIKKEDFILIDKKEGTRKKSPPPPFTTSSMQQASVNRLGINIKKTMQIAQKLYEGVGITGLGHTGLITYMRTDSTRISDVARESAKKIITEKFGETYFENRFYKSKKSAQDAHEAIRPAHIELTPERVKNDLSKDEYKLYNLIYTRFIASLMKDSIYKVAGFTFLVKDKYIFKTNSSKLDFQGYLKVYNDINPEENEIDIFPEINVGDRCKYVSGNGEQNFTAPPSRYTESSLVKKMEENGIGRPSTYVQAIWTLISRRYISKDGKTIVPEKLGFIVEELLEKYFTQIVDSEFTANIEQKLDNIAEGSEDWKKMLGDFYDPFKEDLDVAMKEIEKITVETPVVLSDEICEKCGKQMVIKDGRFGKFLACSGFPECKNTKPIENIITEKCPICGGDVLVRKTKKRRNFYICKNNKGENTGTCTYISWTKPGEEKKVSKKRTSKTTKKVSKKTKK